MNKLTIAVLGLGNFGKSWAAGVVPACGEAELVCCIDQNPATHAGISVPCYTDLGEALAAHRPEAVVNATTPGLHSALNRRMLEAGAAVLCEKPIAEELSDAEGMLQYVTERGLPLVIADNYRFVPVFRAAKKLLDGRFGRILSVSCVLSQKHPDYSAFYHGRLAHPLLLDVAIHHLDVARFLIGAEPDLETVFAREFPAPHTWYGSRPASAVIYTDLGGAAFTYRGSLADPVALTDWYGDWDITCGRGTLRIRKSRLWAVTPGGEEEVPADTSSDGRGELLKEFIRSYRAQDQAETDIRDNIGTYRWLADVIKAAGQ